jgi:DEAD/DEAH box helicase domain-containing protein
LELGIDIGEITLVVNLGTPPTIKSFWQRAGRAGRRSEGYVLLLDTDGRIAGLGLDRYLQQPPESNWFYVENEYLQYANALCAADEYQQASQPLYSNSPLSDMPESFRDFLENEITPTRPIPHELYPLKQQALASGHPHYAFPVRTSIEKSYKVECPHLPGQGLGSLTYSQLLREAFPGALYRYMGRPYRIWDLKHAQGRVIAGNAKSYGITRPTSQTMVFPKFTDEIYFLKKSNDSFICECCVQVSLRVIGFIEQFGNSKNEVKYEPGCRYAQKPLANYYDTSGVCFFFPEDDLQREALGRYIASAFCRICAVQDRDVSSGLFVCSNMSPIGQGQIRGVAVFDTTVGSLRLTRQIPERLEEILLEGIRMAREAEANKIAEGLALLLKKAAELKKQDIHSLGSVALSTGPNEGWITVVTSNQTAICHDGVSHINEEVIVLGYLYTPQGIRYKLRHPRDGVQWQVTASMIHPINGNTQLEQYNINTGETRASSA